MKKGLVRSIVAAVFAVVSFVGLAFNAGVSTISAGNYSDSHGFSFKEWGDLLDSGAEKTGLWKLSQVLMILTFILVVAAVAIAFVRVWVDNKVVNILLKVLSIVALVLSILFIVSYTAGGLVYASNDSTGTIGFWPNVGTIVVALGSIVASSVLIPGRTKKA